MEEFERLRHNGGKQPDALTAAIYSGNVTVMVVPTPTVLSREIFAL